MNYDDRVTKEYVEGLIAGAGAKIATGSYVGTGEYGENHPNSLTFDFAPKLVYISTDIHTDGGEMLFLFRGAPHGHFLFGNPAYAIVQASNVTWTENGLSWFSIGSRANAEYQCNISARTYYYTAIG